jgi:protein gp37
MRHTGPGGAYAGLVEKIDTPAGNVVYRWTGRSRLVAEKLGEYLGVEGERVFVNSMSDLFFEEVPFEFIAAVLGVIAATPRSDFLVLTKRCAQAGAFFAWLTDVAGSGGEVAYCVRAARRHGVKRMPETVEAEWPLPNLWLGVSAEDQQRADERVPVLLGLPAGVRWVSYEPALGPVTFERWLSGPVRLDWIVIGGESGNGARPFDLDWAREVIGECMRAGVAAFMKQTGAHAVDGSELVSLRSKKGNVPLHWPTELRVREYPRRSR